MLSFDVTERLVREPERARITGVSRAHWSTLEREGNAPRRILLGARSIAWRASDLLQWIDERAAVVDSPEARARRAPPVPSAKARVCTRRVDVEGGNAA